jgi:hypothetical protein
VATIHQEQYHGKQDRHQRWERCERADLCKRYGALRIHGVSQRQAAQVLDVPRSTLRVLPTSPRALRRAIAYSLLI